MTKVRISWGIPTNRKIEEEVGRIMINILQYTISVEADNEGAILELSELVELEELEELKKSLKYVSLDIEPSQIE